VTVERLVERVAGRARRKAVPRAEAAE